MALYHAHIQVINRASGRTSVAAAAYRAGCKLHNFRDGFIHDYTQKSGVVYSQILLPQDAPAQLADRETLWNSVEQSENRKDAQLAREIVVALPKELILEEQIKLVQEVVNEQFIKQGMIADFSVHDKKDDNPHAHIMLTMRIVTPEGFGKKNRAWNDRKYAEIWREAWARYYNKALENLGLEQRVDHRSYRRQGLDKIPTRHLGPAANAQEKRGIKTARGEENRRLEQIEKKRQAARGEQKSVGERVEQNRPTARREQTPVVARFEPKQEVARAEQKREITRVEPKRETPRVEQHCVAARDVPSPETKPREQILQVEHVLNNDQSAQRRNVPESQERSQASEDSARKQEMLALEAEKKQILEHEKANLGRVKNRYLQRALELNAKKTAQEQIRRQAGDYRAKAQSLKDLAGFMQQTEEKKAALSQRLADERLSPGQRVVLQRQKEQLDHSLQEDGQYLSQKYGLNREQAHDHAGRWLDKAASLEASMGKGMNSDILEKILSKLLEKFLDAFQSLAPYLGEGLSLLHQLPALQGRDHLLPEQLHQLEKAENSLADALTQQQSQGHTPEGPSLPVPEQSPGHSR